MRRAVLAMVLCAAPLLAGPVHAAGGLQERQALRAALQLQAGAAGTPHVLPLPLPDPRTGRAVSASARSELTRIARRRGPRRVLVGVTRHSALPGVRRALERLGAEPEAFRPIGVLAATVPSGAALVRALGGDPRVAYIERDGRLRIAADPLDTLDPATGIKYTWAYDGVRAADALAAAGGGSQRSIAVMDTGLDVNHPEIAGRITHTFDTDTRSADVFDAEGHGTFVTGLIAGIDGNGVGGKGVAGNTRVLAIRASLDGGFDERDLLRGIAFAVNRGADVLNMSLAGDGLHESVARALGNAFFNDVLPVAATRPNGAVARFSTHNRFVSLAAPGAGRRGCANGVLSTLPANVGTEWDEPDSCSRLIADPSGARFAYAEGTSFAAPLVSGLAALVWQVEPRLASEQVAEVMTRSARQTRGRGWNEFTGRGVVDGRAATRLARTYDGTAPRARASGTRTGSSVFVRLLRTRDRTERGRELAGRVAYNLVVSRDGGRNFDALVTGRRRPFSHSVALRGRRRNVIVATACDRNGNCGVRRLGSYDP